MNNQVFISYSSKDHALVREAIERLQKEGVLGSEAISSVESPLEPDAALHIRSEIKDRISNSSFVILVWSKQAANSPWVQYELGMAQALDRPIVVVWADKTAPQLPPEIAGSRVVELETESA